MNLGERPSQNNSVHKYLMAVTELRERPLSVLGRMNKPSTWLVRILGKSLQLFLLVEHIYYEFSHFRLKYQTSKLFHCGRHTLTYNGWVFLL